jgi:hypothetical protein
MIASLCWVAFVVRAPWYGVAAMAAVMFAGVAFISRFPSRSPRPVSAPDAEADASR